MYFVMFSHNKKIRKNNNNINKYSYNKVFTEKQTIASQHVIYIIIN